MFNFIGGEAAEREYRAELSQWMNLDGSAKYKGCYPAMKTKEVWDDLRVWCSKSETAVEMFRYIDDSKQIIDVVGMQGGFVCFASTAGQGGKHATIFVDLDYRGEILARTSHNLHLTKDRLAAMPPMGGKSWVALSNNVTLIHETGHAKQFIETPGLFDNDYRTETVAPQGGGKLPMKVVSAQEIYAKAEAMAKKTASGTGIRPQSALSYESRSKKPEDLSFLPMRDMEGTIQLENPVGWSVAAESDNMNRHEWPICRELGLPIRSSYGAIRQLESAPAAQLTTLITRWAKEEQALRNKMARVAQTRARAAKAAGTSLVCSRCAETFTISIDLEKHWAQAPHHFDG